MEHYYELVQQLKQDPQLPDPQALTERIMQSVRSQSKHRSKPVFLRKPGLTATRPARFALAGFLLVVIGMFVLQEILILKRLHNLESRMETQEQRTISEHDDILASLLRSELECGTKDKILVDRQTFIQLVNKVAQNKSPATIEQLLQAESLELQEITFSNGLDRREIATLLAHRQDILKELKKL